MLILFHIIITAFTLDYILNYEMKMFSFGRYHDSGCRQSTEIHEFVRDLSTALKIVVCFMGV